MFKHYYLLAKPGMVYGNTISAIAGFLFASKGNFNLILFVTTILGISLVIASACVFNNYLDREIDKKMLRTSKRPLVMGSISPLHALIYGTILAILGFGLLLIFTNLLTLALGFIGWFFYVAIYGFVKRRSTFGTLVGSVSGSMPLVGGYCAVTNQFDTAALLLFIIMTIWQMPHFYAIAIYRLADYKKAGLPVLPVVKGTNITKVDIIIYVLAFLVASYLLFFYHYAGYIYLIIMLGLGLYWLRLSTIGLHTSNDELWGRSVFKFSLIILLVFCVLLSFSYWLP